MAGGFMTPEASQAFQKDLAREMAIPYGGTGLSNEDLDAVILKAAKDAKFNISRAGEFRFGHGGGTNRNTTIRYFSTASAAQKYLNEIFEGLHPASSLGDAWLGCRVRHGRCRIRRRNECYVR